MRLYHGTNVEFTEIDLSKSNHYKDFGQGFYLTDIRQQAVDLSQKRATRDGGIPIVQEYEFNERLLCAPTLKVLRFNRPTAEWAEFIYKNRSRQKPAFHHDYDIVTGPIADDGVAYLLNRYEEGSYTIEELARELDYKQLNSQYFFGTIRAVSLLKRIK